MSKIAAQEKKVTHHHQTGHQDHHHRMQHHSTPNCYPVLAQLCEGGNMCHPIRRCKSAEEMLMDPGLPVTPVVPTLPNESDGQFPLPAKPASFRPPSFHKTGTATKKNTTSTCGQLSTQVYNIVLDSPGSSEGDDDSAVAQRKKKHVHRVVHDHHGHHHQPRPSKHHGHHTGRHSPMVKSPILAELVEGGNMPSRGSNHLSAHDLLLDPGLPATSEEGEDTN